MRKLLITMALLAAAASGHAQAIIGKMYTIVPDYVNVYGVNRDNNADTAKRFRASSNTKFTVTGFDNDHNIKITFWRYRYSKPAELGQVSKKDSTTKDTAIKKRANYTRVKSTTEQRKSAELYNFNYPEGYIGIWANYKEFAMSPEDFNAACIPYFGKDIDFTSGVMTLPIKLRPGNSNERFFNFEEKLNLGFVFGVRQQLTGTSQHSFNYLVGVGIANVRTDSLSQKSGIAPSGTSTAAFSTSLGVLYAHGNFQVGIFAGKDFIPSALGRDWKYQGKPWIGLAVGISLFSNSNTQGSEGDNVALSAKP